MKRLKFIVGGTVFVLSIAFSLSNYENKPTKATSLASLISMSQVQAEDSEGFWDTWLWIEQLTTSDCTFTETTTVRIQDPNNPGSFIMVVQTVTMEGHWQNCIDGPEFCSSGCVGDV